MSLVEFNNTHVKVPKVTLFNWPQYALEAVYANWEQSKEDKQFRMPAQIREEVPPNEVRDLFKRIVRQRIPVGEGIHFSFLIEHASVSWREQAVRHRIGTSPSPERLGADMVVDVREIPDRANSSFWSQSMRIQNMGMFADNNDFRVPESILLHKNAPELLSRFTAAMEMAQNTYNDLVAQGIPMEDAREVIPLGAQQRISWTLNISSLQHIVGERGCWILQLGLWGPIIQGMIKELCEKVDPVFADLVTPPCIDASIDSSDWEPLNPFDATTPPPEWKGCIYHEENARRYDGRDALPPCSLHVTQHANKAQRDMIGVEMTQAIGERAAKYEKFWQRNPWNGRRLRVIR